MSDEKQPKKIAEFKFNPIWIYIIVISIFAFLWLSKEVTFVEPQQISAAKFDELLEQGKIEKIIIFNDANECEATLTPLALKDKIYNKIQNNTAGKPNKGPHLIFDIGNGEIFQNKIIKAKNEKKIKNYSFDKKPN